MVHLYNLLIILPMQETFIISVHLKYGLWMSAKPHLNSVDYLNLIISSLCLRLALDTNLLIAVPLSIQLIGSILCFLDNFWLHLVPLFIGGGQWIHLWKRVRKCRGGRSANWLQVAWLIQFFHDSFIYSCGFWGQVKVGPHRFSMAMISDTCHPRCPFSVCILKFFIVGVSSHWRCSKSLFVLKWRHNHIIGSLFISADSLRRECDVLYLHAEQSRSNWKYISQKNE